MASPSTSSIHRRFNNDATSSTPPVLKRFTYDVFLSFCGIDTRKNVVDHLYDALQRKGIRTYKDDERITKGKQICDELIGSIEDSKLYIIIFSKNYASSSWCLDELVKIMECQKTNDHTAYPLFYDVEPTEVRHQSGAVEEAFKKHENKAAAGKWRMALTEAADLAGWELKNTADGHEAKFIQKVIEEISLEIRGINFAIDEKLVGMDTRINDVLASVGTSDDDAHARLIGIVGMGGAGKTTLARAIYDQISFKFEGKSFVENVREVSGASFVNLKSLQNQILSDVFNDKSMSVSSVHEGIGMMKRMMPCKKVILVLDDVNHRDQLKALAADMTWFKPGSIVIITTREQQVLEIYREKLIHDVQLLSYEDAMCLFRRYAFGKVTPNPEYEELSRQFVKYAAGLPLAIEVLGSSLCGKDELEWKDALSRLKKIPSQEVLEILEISYRGLEEEYKEIFLNVACFLKGWWKDEAIKALECCGFYAQNGLRVLEKKSLITVNKYGNLSMHDRIEEMGMNIVRRSHPHNPNKHSRLWIDEEIKDILAKNLGTEATRYLLFNIRQLNLEIAMQGLRKMKELIFLHMSGGFYDASTCGCFHWSWKFNKLPKTLRYLCWKDYPFRALPKSFQGDNLVALKMPDSRIVHLWERGEKKVLNELRFLDLTHSELRTFDLGVAPKLETLDLGKCWDLTEFRLPDGCLNLRSLKLDESMLSYLDLRLAPKLETLALQRCMLLKELRLPDECVNLRSLKLDDSKLSYLDLRLARNLETLTLQRCMDLIELHLPDRCSNLRRLNLNDLKLRILTIGLSPNLEYLNLRNCHDLQEFHMADGCLEKLVYLDLSGCLSFRSFAFEIDNGPCTRADESLRSGPLAELWLIAESVDECHLHPDSNLPKFQFKCHYKEHQPLLSRNIEKLISVGLCACTDLDTFSRSICGLQNLGVLSLNGSILEAPKDLDQLQFLKWLHFSDTKIRHLPDNICVLKHLESIELSNCTLLEKLPEDLGQLECLERLDFSYTNIEVLPGSICKLKHLESLTLDGCSLLQKLPENFGQLECLKSLILSHTSVKELPDSICMLKHLEILNLDKCSLLQKLPENLGQLECLKKLFMSTAKIRYLPDSICVLQHLGFLDLINCSLLERLPEGLDRLECLEMLYLRGCELLRELPDSICKMKCLKLLDLRGCLRVEKLPEEIGRLQCLNLLDLRNTGISHLPQSILLLKGLCIHGSRELLQSSGFTSEIQQFLSLNGTSYYVTV